MGQQCGKIKNVFLGLIQIHKIGIVEPQWIKVDMESEKKKDNEYCICNSFDLTVSKRKQIDFQLVQQKG